MIPRQPPEASEDDMQQEVLQAVHNALSEAEPANLAEETQNDPDLQSNIASLQVASETQDTEVEIDRAEIYRRGPTAFTA